MSLRSSPVLRLWRAGLLAGALALGGLRRSSLAAQVPVSVDSARLMAMVRVLAADSMVGRKLGLRAAPVPAVI
jgi:hypothetical protein